MEGMVLLGKNACVCVCVYDGLMVRMLVSFCNSNDRWSGFDRKLVLISPFLWGEMGQSGRDKIHSLAAKLLERKSSELLV